MEKKKLLRLAIWMDKFSYSFEGQRYIRENHEPVSYEKIIEIFIELDKP